MERKALANTHELHASAPMASFGLGAVPRHSWHHGRGIVKSTLYLNTKPLVEFNSHPVEE